MSVRNEGKTESADIAAAEQRGALRALRALDQAMRNERLSDPSTYNVWSRVRGVIDTALDEALSSPPATPEVRDGFRAAVGGAG